MRHGMKIALAAFLVATLLASPTAAADEGIPVSSESTATSEDASTSDPTLIGPDPPGQGCRPTCQ